MSEAVAMAIDSEAAPELIGQALSQILAIERRLKRAIAAANRPLAQWIMRRVRATGRIEQPLWLWAEAMALMKRSMMSAAVAAWEAGYGHAGRNIARRRAVAGFRDAPPGPLDMYLQEYERAVDGALYRYEQATRRRFAELTQRAAVEGWAIEQLTREVKSVVMGMTTWQAERIARTEVMRLWNVGAFQRMEQEDEDLIGYEYSVVMDDRTSHICARLDGTKVERERLLYVPPLHPHCRTILSPVYSFDDGAAEIEWKPPETARPLPGFGQRPALLA